MYYICENNILLSYSDIKYNEICQYTDIITVDELVKNQNKIIVIDNKLQLNPNYENEETQKRQADFENNFLSTPLGNYRLQPKGYANAQQSIDTVNALATMLGGLNETLCSMVIFYATPDFSKPEECTEEWLVEHQSHPQPMALQQWAEFYITFSTLYAQKMYKKNED